MAFLIRAARAIPVSPSGRSLTNRPFFICNPFIIVSVFTKIIIFVRYLGVEGYYALCARGRPTESDVFFDRGVVVWLAVVQLFWVFWLACRDGVRQVTPRAYPVGRGGGQGGAPPSVAPPRPAPLPPRPPVVIVLTPCRLSPNDVPFWSSCVSIQLERRKNIPVREGDLPFNPPSIVSQSKQKTKWSCRVTCCVLGIARTKWNVTILLYVLRLYSK